MDDIAARRPSVGGRGRRLLRGPQTRDCVQQVRGVRTMCAVIGDMKQSCLSREIHYLNISATTFNPLRNEILEKFSGDAVSPRSRTIHYEFEAAYLSGLSSEIP